MRGGSDRFPSPREERRESEWYTVAGKADHVSVLGRVVPGFVSGLGEKETPQNPATRLRNGSGFFADLTRFLTHTSPATSRNSIRGDSRGAVFGFGQVGFLASSWSHS